MVYDLSNIVQFVYWQYKVIMFDRSSSTYSMFSDKVNILWIEKRSKARELRMYSLLHMFNNGIQNEIDLACTVYIIQISWIQNAHLQPENQSKN